MLSFSPREWKLKNRYVWLLVFAISFIFTSMSHALETQAGDACTAGEVDHIRKTGGPENSGVSEVLICNGSQWGAVTMPCTPDPSCLNVGDICSGNGSGGGNPKFAGCFCYYDNNSDAANTCRALYATNATTNTGLLWKTTAGTNDIATDSKEDGKLNDAQVPNSNTFPAFKVCKDLTDGGYTDWYLPARAELELLWRNRAAIGNMAVLYGWSSTERNNDNAWSQVFNNNGVLTDINKTSFVGVRCVRRD